MISINKQKEIIIPKVTQFLGERGFEYLDNSEDLFFKESENKLYKINFYFSSNGLSGNTLYSITFKKIEDIVYDIGLPNISSIPITNKYLILSTIYDNYKTSYPFTDRGLKIGIRNPSSRIKINEENDLYLWINNFKKYILEEGEGFINDYKSILDLNKGIDGLEKNGERGYSKLILGGIDHLFRVLIISKLCNDSKYHERQERFDNIILQPKYENWHPHYKRLKVILSTTTPLYNTETF